MAANAGTAFIHIQPDFSGYNKSVAEHLHKPLRQSVHLAVHSESLTKMKDAVKAGITDVAQGGAVAIAAMGAEVVRATKGWADHEAIVRRTTATIASTQGAARVTTQHINDLTDAIERQTGVDGDLVQQGANLLLTFTNIRDGVGKNNDIFDQATRVTTNMSKALGQDTKSSAIQLGKALNDPIKGITALQRVGVSFTDKQKQQIKTLVESGKTMEAQKIILQELNKEFPKVDATPFEKLKVVLHQVEDTIGKHVLPIFNKFLNEVTPKLKHIADAADTIFDNKHLNWGQKIAKLMDVVKKEFAPMAGHISQALKNAHLDDKLQKAFEWAAPKILAAVANTGTRAAGVFWNAFKDAPLWEQVAGGAWLAHKLGIDGPAFKLLLKILTPGGGAAGGAINKLFQRGSTPVDPMFVWVVNGGGPGGAIPPDVGSGGADSPSKLGKVKDFFRGGAPGEGGLNEVFANKATGGLLSRLGIGSTLALGVQGFASGSKAPGNEPIAKLKAMAHGADPTNILHIVGLPSVTDLLHWGSTTPMQQAQQRYIAGTTSTKGWSGTQASAHGGPELKQTASVKQQNEDYKALNATLAKLETHQKGVKDTAWNLDWLGKRATKLGDIKMGFADHLGAEMLRAKGASSKGITKVLGEVAKLPPGAKKQASDAMILMAKGMEASGEVPQGTAAKVVSALLDTTFSLHADQKRGSKATGAKMSADLIGALTLVGQKGVPINETTKSTLLGQFETLRKKGGDKFTNPKTGIKAEAIRAFQDLQGGVVPTGDATAMALYNAFKNMHLNAKQLADALGVKVPDVNLTVPGANIKTNLRTSANPRGVAILKAGGGLIQIGQPGARGYDTIPMSVGGQNIVVGEGEQVAVLNTHQQSFLNNVLGGMGGLQGMFDTINRPHYMAKGGSVNLGGHAAPKPQVMSLIGLMEKHFPGLQVTSTTSGGHAGHSYHYLGDAVDMAGDPGTMMAAANYIKSSGVYRSLAEGIHNPNLSVKFGKMVSPSFWGASTWGEHVNHLHLAILGALTGGGAAPQLRRALLNMPKGILKTLGQGAMDRGRDQWNSWLSAHAPSGGDMTDTGFTGGGNSAANRALGHKMMLASPFGWGEDQWSSLDKLWIGESGWDANAVNKSSGAAGIPQALGHGNVFRLGDAAAQIAWGLNYIHDRYGSPSAAYSAWSARSPHWYGRGGIIKAATGHPNVTGGAGLGPKGTGKRIPRSWLNYALPPAARRAIHHAQHHGRKNKAPGKGQQHYWIGQKGPFPFEVTDYHGLGNMAAQVFAWDGSLSGSTGQGDAEKQSSLIDWYTNLYSSAKFPAPNFSSWQSPGDFVLSQDAAGNTVDPYVSTHINDVVKQLGEITGYQATWVTDLNSARDASKKMLPAIKRAINRRKHKLTQITNRVRANIKEIKSLRQNIKAENKRQRPYPHPKTKAQRDANTAFDKQRKDNLKVWNKKIADLHTENQRLVGAPEQVPGTLGGEAGAISTQLGGPSSGGALASILGGGTSASGLYQLSDTVGSWMSQLGGTGGDIDQQNLALQTYTSGLNALLPGANVSLSAAKASSSTVDTSGLADLYKQQAIEGRQDYAVSQAQYAVLNMLPSSLKYGGSFAQGGVVPGPPGAPILIKAHGAEVVTPPGAVGTVENHIHIHDKGIQDLIDVRIDQRNRSASRNAARALPGRGGGVL